MTQEHGFDPEVWERAGEEARQILIQRAREGRTIAYSELVAEVKTIKVKPNSDALAMMLDGISRSEDAAGRGMLSVLVVHKGDDQMSGRGFFKLAKDLGREFDDECEFWNRESKRVIGSWGSEA